MLSLKRKLIFQLFRMRPNLVFTIDAPGRFQYYAVIYLSGPAGKLGGELKYVDRDKNIIRTARKKGNNHAYHWFNLYGNDSVGKERMDIYVNEVLVKTVDYTTQWASDDKRTAYDIEAMPVGFEVLMAPPVNHQNLHGQEQGEYYWCYSIALTNVTDSPLKIIRFGVSDSVYGAKEFKSWYNCPGGVVQPGQTVYHKTAKTWRKDKHWSGTRDWYFVAQDLDEKFYKGQGTVSINP